MRTATRANAPWLSVVRGWDAMVGLSQPERSGGWGIALPAKRSAMPSTGHQLDHAGLRSDLDSTRARGDRLRCRYGRPRTGLRTIAGRHGDRWGGTAGGSALASSLVPSAVAVIGA